MKDNIKIVSDWYSNERSYEYMPKTINKGLNLWEKKVVTDYFLPNTHILDIGCGMGREAFALYDMGFRITAVDISEPIIENAKQLASETKRKIGFVLTSGLSLPFADNIFDILIIWSQTFELFYGEENQIQLLKECKRVLKKGGNLSFSGHDREFQQAHYSQYLIGNKFYAYADTECYWESFTIDEILKLVKQVGFDFVVCERGFFYQEEDGTILHCECRK